MQVKAVHQSKVGNYANSNIIPHQHIKEIWRTFFTFLHISFNCILEDISFEYHISPFPHADNENIRAVCFSINCKKRHRLYAPHFRLTVLFDLVLYTDTLYFRLEYICCMETELSSGFFFHFSGAVRTIEMDFSSVVKATSGGPICAWKGRERELYADVQIT